MKTVQYSITSSVSPLLASPKFVVIIVLYFQHIFSLAPGLIEYLVQNTLFSVHNEYKIDYNIQKMDIDNNAKIFESN